MVRVGPERERRRENGDVRYESTVVLSSIAFILAWNGKVDKIMEQGVIGVVINIALIYLASR